MKIDKNYKLRQIAGENILVKQGAVNADLTKIISLNSRQRYCKALSTTAPAETFSLSEIETFMHDR